jgi:hypothetical protein
LMKIVSFFAAIITVYYLFLVHLSELVATYVFKYIISIYF